MSASEDQFLESLRATFKVEAGEHLQAIAAGLLELEKASDPDERRPLIETVFRAAHSLKGAARSVNFTEIEMICQSVEDTFAAWRRGELAPSPQALDPVHRALDNMTRLVAATESPRVADGPASLPSRTPASHPATVGPPAPVSEPS